MNYREYIDNLEGKEKSIASSQANKIYTRNKLCKIIIPIVLFIIFGIGAIISITQLHTELDTGFFDVRYSNVGYGYEVYVKHPTCSRFYIEMNFYDANRKYLTSYVGDIDNGDEYTFNDYIFVDKEPVYYAIGYAESYNSDATLACGVFVFLGIITLITIPFFVYDAICGSVYKMIKINDNVYEFLSCDKKHILYKDGVIVDEIYVKFGASYTAIPIFGLNGNHAVGMAKTSDGPASIVLSTKIDDKTLTGTICKDRKRKIIIRLDDEIISR